MKEGDAFTSGTLCPTFTQMVGKAEKIFFISAVSHFSAQISLKGWGLKKRTNKS